MNDLAPGGQTPQARTSSDLPGRLESSRAQDRLRLAGTFPVSEQQTALTSAWPGPPSSRSEKQQCPAAGTSTLKRHSGFRAGCLSYPTTGGPAWRLLHPISASGYRARCSPERQLPTVQRASMSSMKYRWQASGNPEQQRYFLYFVDQSQDSASEIRSSVNSTSARTFGDRCQRSSYKR